MTRGVVAITRFSMTRTTTTTRTILKKNSTGSSTAFMYNSPLQNNYHRSMKQSSPFSSVAPNEKWGKSQCRCWSTLHRMYPSPSSIDLSRTTTHTSLTRLFGSKRGIPTNPPGEIEIYNELYPSIDISTLQHKVSIIRQIIGYETYDVSILLTDDELITEINNDTRGMNKPTDILSFPFDNEVIVEPGVLGDAEFDHEDFYNLGEMIVDVPYIERRIEEDREYYENGGKDDDEEEERGVSGAMAKVYDVEERIGMLFVHGMLHLVGYDHETDEDFELMVTKEEEVLKLLKEELEK
uniref:Uncharacterized protein n=1 Tax=Ditylum brightwellii TaxID=49249 RepID=A0A7S1ZIF3_9STRA